MSEAKTYICQCGTQFQGGAALQPPGWVWHAGNLICDDCDTVQQPTTVTCFADRDPANIALQQSATSIRLRSGVYLDLADPRCSDIMAKDIASGLRQPRYCAQTTDLYTIAQHSLMVLQLVEPVAAEIGGPKGDALRRCALMHDAAEAFIHDITSPLKIQLPDYQKLERTFEDRLHIAFGVRWTRERLQIVKRADIQALAIEQRDLMGVTHDWPIFRDIDRGQLAKVTIKSCWSPAKAEREFLKAFRTLFPELERKAA